MNKIKYLDQREWIKSNSWLLMLLLSISLLLNSWCGNNTNDPCEDLNKLIENRVSKLLQEWNTIAGDTLVLQLQETAVLYWCLSNNQIVWTNSPEKYESLVKDELVITEEKKTEIIGDPMYIEKSNNKTYVQGPKATVTKKLNFSAYI